MSHSSSDASEPGSRWERWTFVVLILLTLIPGYFGTKQYEEKYGHDPSSIVPNSIYHTLQLLIMHGVHLEHPVPVLLHVGRFFGVAFLFMVGLVGFFKFFRIEAQMLRLRAPWRRDHVVICGLGDLGFRLAMDARNQGKFVAVIEKQGNAAAIARARQSGICVVEGDACDPETLNKVRIDRAEFLVAVCRDDESNVAIAALARRALPASLRRDKPLVCRLLLRDLELRRLLESHQSELIYGTQKQPPPDSPYRVNFRDLDLHDTAARQAFRLHPLDFEPILKDGEKTVHLVIVGFGPMGQCLAIQAARIGHFANAITRKKRIRITIIDRGIGAKAAHFRATYAKIDNVCDLASQEADPGSPALLAALDELTRASAERQELVTCVLCLEAGSTSDDRENFRIEMELGDIVKNRTVQTLIYQSTRSGYASLFPADAGGTSARPHAFGMVEDIYSSDVLLHESEDRIARALHEDYCENRRKEGQAGTAIVEWDALSEKFKESNRHAADHIPTKLRALGLHDAPLGSGGSLIKNFSEDQILLLAQMEHNRWCAERWLDNWEHGPQTIREKKISKDLVPWEQLPPGEQQKDYEQIRAIPKVLFDSVRGIYR